MSTSGVTKKWVEVLATPGRPVETGHRGGPVSADARVDVGESLDQRPADRSPCQSDGGR